MRQLQVSAQRQELGMGLWRWRCRHLEVKEAEQQEHVKRRDEHIMAQDLSLQAQQEHSEVLERSVAESKQSEARQAELHRSSIEAMDQKLAEGELKLQHASEELEMLRSLSKRLN